MGGAEGVGSDRVSTEPMSFRGGAGKADPQRKGRGIARPFTARQATRQRGQQELGQAANRAGEKDSKPGSGPAGGTRRHHQVLCSAQEKGSARGREKGGQHGRCWKGLQGSGVLS